MSGIPERGGFFVLVDMGQRTQHWRNRLTGGIVDVPPDQLVPSDLNFRRHPGTQQDALSGVINEIGYLDPVLVQAGTDRVIDGHLRVELAMRTGQPTIPVQYVDLTDAEADLALATFDPLSAMAYHDAANLKELLETVSTGDAAVMAMLSQLAEQEGIIPATETATASEKYTTKIETPLYEPTGERPAVADLTDTTRHDALRQAIDAADVPDDVRAFLRVAATRHVVFDYRKIAEFYAHADADVQRLMEDSALVIIDFNRAIELGYAKLRDDMLDMIEDARHG